MRLAFFHKTFVGGADFPVGAVAGWKTGVTPLRLTSSVRNPGIEEMLHESSRRVQTALFALLRVAGPGH